MNAPAIVQTLPYVAWILLVALAMGSMAYAVLTRQLSDATTGYLRFVAATAAVLAVLAANIDTGVAGGVTTAQLAVHQATSSYDTLRNDALLVFAGLCVAYVVVVRRNLPALVVGALALIASLAVLAAASLGWAESNADAVPLLVQLGALSFVTGGAMASIVLGHWYLVTPKISERPLILQTRLLLGGLIVQALLFVTWTTLGGGPGQAGFSAFRSGPVLLVALRLIVTIVFPIVLAWMAWRTARTRSMESATGLLYINLAAVMAGTIGAAALYVSGGILV